MGELCIFLNEVGELCVFLNELGELCIFLEEVEEVCVFLEEVEDASLSFSLQLVPRKPPAQLQEPGARQEPPFLQPPGQWAGYDSNIIIRSWAVGGG